MTTVRETSATVDLAELRARYEVVYEGSGLAARGEVGEPAS